MQNIPFLVENETTKLTVEGMRDRVQDKQKSELFSELLDKQTHYAEPAPSDTKDELMQDVFDGHDDLVDRELGTAPVSTENEMHNAAPSTSESKEPEKKEVLKPSESVVNRDEDDQESRDESEIPMTREDINALREDLKEYGLSDEEIKEYEDQIDSEDGLTWGEFVASLNEKMEAAKKVELSSEQMKDLQSFLGKLGFSTEESHKLISQIQNGNQEKALEAIMKKVDSLPKDQTLLFSKGEVEAFSAAMNSSKEFTAQIKQLLGKEALPKDMKEAFSLIKQQFNKADEKDMKLVKAVSTTLAKTMSKELKESSAASQTGKAVDMTERVKNEARTNAKDALASKAKSEAGENGDAKTDAKAKSDNAGQNVRGEAHDPKAAMKQNSENSAKQTETHKSGEHAAQKQSTQDNDFSKTVKQEQENSTHKNSARENAQNPAMKNNAALGHKTGEHSNQPFQEGDDSNKNAWKDFFGKARTDNASARSTGRNAAEALAEGAKNSAANAAKNAFASMGSSEKAASAWEKISAPKVMRQVNDAVFKNLGQGTKQLTIQLTPEKLGALKVVLQVHGKEVNATIKAEHSDSAKIIADNVESLKQSLENQGLKVNKIDVQTGLADNSNANNWQGMNQHNSAREREAMTRLRDRMRSLRGTQEQGLAHEMQNMNSTANVAEQGLHIIA